jgi:hypothetical protein
MNKETDFFSEQGPISNPGSYIYLFDDLPDTIDELVKVVQGLTIHVFWAERYGLIIPGERMSELQLRTMEKRLAGTLQLDPRPLQENRSIDKRLIGNCRDFSLLMVSMLRQKGIPARARCGFGAYFENNKFIDHWVAEYWNAQEERWVMVDAQLDGLQCEVLKIRFNPLDVPRDQFIVGGKAWQMCRQQNANQKQFGIMEMNGMGFIRGNVVRDIASLNKVEMLPWDCWGIILAELNEVAATSGPTTMTPQERFARSVQTVSTPTSNEPELSLIDQIASLSALDTPDTDQLHEIYQSDPRLRMDGTLVNFVNGKPVEITL